MIGPSIGGTKIKVHGLGFEVFPLSEEEKKHLTAKKKESERKKAHRDDFEELDSVSNELWVRYMGLDGNLLAGPFLVDDEDYNND